MLTTKPADWRWSAVAGMLAGCAALCTLPMLAVACAVAAVLLFRRVTRHSGIGFVFGVALPIGVASVVLAAQHLWEPMLENMAWVGQHYRAANQVPYGWEVLNAEGDTSALHRLLVLMPATLPIVTLLVVALARRRRMGLKPEAALLLAAGLAAVLACYPRWAANQLLFAAPLLLSALVLTVHSLVPQGKRSIVYGLSTGLALVAAVAMAGQPSRTKLVDTQLGTLRTSNTDASNIEFAVAAVHPGESLFVYPYQPIWYSLTGGVNPTYYDFLQPCMMTLDDETRALRELEAHPPQWIIWHSLPEKTILAIWPNSDRATLHFRRIEQFIRTRYARLQPPDVHFRYAIAVFGRVR